MNPGLWTYSVHRNPWRSRPLFISVENPKAPSSRSGSLESSVIDLRTSKLSFNRRKSPPLAENTSNRSVQNLERPKDPLTQL